MFRLPLIAALVACAAAAAEAQTPVALSGVVSDSTGAALVGAVVEARVNGRVVAAATTGGDGRYRMELPSGATYDVLARQSGFSDETIQARLTSDTTRDFVLQVGAVGDRVIVTASRLAERLATAPQSITAITADEIAATGARDLGDVIRAVPGLSVEATGREGAVASVFARGGESDYNHVLIDGVRVNANGGQFDFSRISAADVDRVEVVRGAQSALYGSDAMGSVVQVFTRRAAPGDRPHLAGAVEGGSFGSWRGDVHLLGGAGGRADYQVGVNYRATRGAFAGLLPEDDRFRQGTLTANVGTILGDRATVRTGVRYSDARGRGVGPIAYGSRDTGTVADSTDVSWHLDLTHRLAPGATQTMTAAYFRASRLSEDRVGDPAFDVFAILRGEPGARFPESPRLVRLIDEATFSDARAGRHRLNPGEFVAWTPFGVGDFPFASRTQLRRPAFRYQADLRWGDGQVLSGGYDFERESNPLAAGFSTVNHAVFGQQQFTARDRWFVTVGGRLDRNSRYGTEFSPKLSLGGWLRPPGAGALSSVKAFANLGRGIKNPLFGELFGSAFSDGNPDLRPERARTVDAGVEITLDDQRWRARVAYFDNSFRDQVAFKSTGFSLDGRPDFINIDGSEAHGWEVEGRLQRPVKGLSVGATFSRVDTRVVASVSTSEQFQPGQPLLRRPKHAGVLYGSYTVRRAAVHVHARLVGQRHDAAFLGLSAVPSPGSPIVAPRAVDITVNPAYAVVGVGADYRLHDRATIVGRIDNLADRAYEGALGYPGLPRSVGVGARFTIGR